MNSGLSRLSHYKTSFARASDWKFSEHACMPALGGMAEAADFFLRTPSLTASNFAAL